MPTMFTRLLKPPTESIFLFGPRGTGKSTWIRHCFPEVTLYDLLSTTESLRLSRDPGALFHEVHTLASGSWVVIDEIQRVPALLDEVHRLMETTGLRFILSGSSARKLRRGGRNLLAGRAVVRNLFPLVSAEISSDIDIRNVLIHGTLPLAVTGDDPVSYLTTYTETYLQEEVRAEALTRDIGGFSRFLEIAARQNGQVINASNISRDAGVSRSTVQNYFEILIDTLIGHWIRPWKLKRSTKQVTHSKFYLFDSGVARALSGRLPYPPAPEEMGPLLETFLLGEMRAYVAYNKLHYPLFFWRSYNGVEVDFLVEDRNGFVAIEVKAATSWNKRFNRGLQRIREELGPNRIRCIGVFLGGRKASWDGVDVIPVSTFLERLWTGELIR